MNALVKAVITFISSCYLVLIEFHLVNCLGDDLNQFTIYKFITHSSFQFF